MIKSIESTAAREASSHISAADWPRSRGQPDLRRLATLSLIQDEGPGLVIRQQFQDNLRGEPNKRIDQRHPVYQFLLRAAFSFRQRKRAKF
jgi:hypothetical protein